MPDALAARENGVPLVNIAQVFNRSGLMLTCKKASGMTRSRPQGPDLGVWFGGNEYPFLNWMAKLKADQRRCQRHQGAQAGLQRRSAAAESGRPHLHHDLQRVLAGDRRRRKESDLVTFFYEDQAWPRWRTACTCSSPTLKDPAFVKQAWASSEGHLQGLERRGQEPDRGRVQIVVKVDTSGSAKEAVQKRQMENVAVDQDRRHAQVIT